MNAGAIHPLEQRFFNTHKEYSCSSFTTIQWALTAVAFYNQDINGGCTFCRYRYLPSCSVRVINTYFFHYTYVYQIFGEKNCQLVSKKCSWHKWMVKMFLLVLTAAGPAMFSCVILTLGSHRLWWPVLPSPGGAVPLGGGAVADPDNTGALQLWRLAAGYLLAAGGHAQWSSQGVQGVGSWLQCWWWVQLNRGSVLPPLGQRHEPFLPSQTKSLQCKKKSAGVCDFRLTKKAIWN